MKLSGLILSAAAASTLFGTPPAAAADCPDIDVVFARGTWEPPGVGNIGQAFVGALRSQAGGKTVNVYAVNYPASTDFPRAVDGVVDASNHIRAMALRCPQAKMVLGGYSQGAAVMGFLTADAIPDGFDAPPGLTGPMPNDVVDHIAAVALFGKPSPGFMNTIGAPQISIGPLYAAKTIDLCATADPICSDTGNDGTAHGMYAVNGMVGQAAQFAVNLV